MCIRNSAFIVLCSAIVFSASSIAKDIAIYRWVDENNVVHFSQHQPQDDKFSQLTTFASYKAKRQAKSNTLSTFEKKILQHEEEQAEALDKNKVIAEKNCKAAKLNIKTLNSFSVVSVLDSDGKNKILTNKEKESQIALSNKHVDLYCKNNKAS